MTGMLDAAMAQGFNIALQFRRGDIKTRCVWPRPIDTGQQAIACEPRDPALTKGFPVDCHRMKACISRHARDNCIGS